MYFVYILLCNNTTFYTGFTNNISRRILQHKRKEVRFTSIFVDIKLVYLEKCETKDIALAREKQIKGWTKRKKVNLIKRGHPEIGQ